MWECGKVRTISYPSDYVAGNKLNSTIGWVNFFENLEVREKVASFK